MKVKRMMAAFILVAAFVLENFCTTFAGTMNFIPEEMKFLYEGYTEDGIKYRIYEMVEDVDDTMPCIIASKTKKYSIAYDGHITPPSTFYYSQMESDLGIVMSGTLYLKSYHHDCWPFFPKSTVAQYEGTIVGNL